MTENLDELARAWWEAHRLAEGTRDERKLWNLGAPVDVRRGWEKARDLVERGGEAALDLVLALLDSAPAEAGTATVGAGPLEDLVVLHGAQLVDRIAELARQSAPFREALSCVWLDGADLSPAAAFRLAPWLPSPRAGL